MLIYHETNSQKGTVTYSCLKISFKKNVSMSWETQVLIIWEKALSSACCFDRELPLIHHFDLFQVLFSSLGGFISHLQRIWPHMKNQKLSGGEFISVF